MVTFLVLLIHHNLIQKKIHNFRSAFEAAQSGAGGQGSRKGQYVQMAYCVEFCDANTLLRSMG